MGLEIKIPYLYKDLIRVLLLPAASSLVKVGSPDATGDFDSLAFLIFLLDFFLFF